VLRSSEIQPGDMMQGKGHNGLSPKFAAGLQMRYIEFDDAACCMKQVP